MTMGAYMILTLGLINCVLLTFQLLTGLKIVRVPFGVHKNRHRALLHCGASCDYGASCIMSCTAAG